jgi:ribonuclease BN (tRNA processing enzyme)
MAAGTGGFVIRVFFALAVVYVENDNAFDVRLTLDGHAMQYLQAFHHQLKRICLFSSHQHLICTTRASERTLCATKHAMESYGYRFDTKDRSIVISGDTNPTEATIAACNNCDVLIHEVHSPAWLESRPATFQQFASKYHTTTPELAELSKRARPKLLILYHWNAFSLEELFREMSTLYPGHFVVARDLDVY